MPLTPMRQLPDLPLVDNAVIPYASLRRATRATNLLKDAQHRAKGLVHDAEKAAQARRDHAFLQGHEAGLAQAAALVATYFANCERWQVTLHDQVVANVTHTLAGHLDDPTWLMRLTEDLIRQRETYRSAPMSVSLPQHAKAIRPALRQQLEQAGVSAQIDLVDGTVFAVRWGDEVVEFDTTTVADSIVQTTLRAVDHPLQAARTRNLTRHFLDSALQQYDALLVNPKCKE